MALYRENATGFVQEWASNPGATHTAITAQPTDTLANRVTWWRNVDKGSQTSSWHPSEYRTPQDPAEAVLSMAFSKDAAFFSADSTGAVTDAYLGGSCTVSVTRGTSDVTVSEGWSLTKVDSGCTSTLTQSGGVWTLTITSVPLLATKSGYVRVTATRTNSTTQVRDWNWMKVPAGADGLNGNRTAILEMYQWAAVAPTAFPSGSSTYTWATGQFTAPATLNGWSLTPPATVVGQTLWVCRTFYADSGTSATSAITWSATAAYASGGAGANGTRTAVLEMYQWAASAPVTFPSGSSTYTWATGGFTAPATPNSWSLTPGAAVAGQTLWGCQMLFADTGTSTTSAVTWSTSTAYAVGSAGTNGTSASVLTLSADSSSFRVAKDGTSSPAAINFTAYPAGALTGSATFTTSPVVTLTGTGNTRALSYANMGANTAVTVTATLSGYSDSTTVVKVIDGTDAITTVVPNDNNTFQAASDGTVSSYTGSGTTISVYEGATALSASASAVVSAFRVGTITQSPAASITVGTVTYAGTTATIPDYSGFVAGTDSVVLSVPITVYRANGTSSTLNRSITLSKSKAGATGPNGTRTAILEMYQWAASAPATFPVGSSTYTWATGQFTAPATLNSWSLTPPAAVLGQTLWICRTIYADSGTSATSAVTWSATAAYASGGAGANGTRTAILEMYIWSATTPATFPSGSSTYTWATGAFTAPATPNSWSLTPGAAVTGQTLWGCKMAYSDTGTSTTSAVTWSTSTAYALGAAGTNGTNGVDGTRGSRQLLVTTADGLWVDLTAWNGVVTQTGTTPVLSDLVTIAKTDGSVATSKFCTGNSASPGVWTAPNAYINGSLLVTGTVGANQIAAGSITTSKLAVGPGGNLLSNSAPTPGSETADYLVGFKNVTPAVTLAAGASGEYPIGGASIKATVGGTPTSGQVFTVEHADTISVVAGQNYEISAYITQTGCSQAFVFVDWLTSALTWVSSSYGTVTAGAPSNTLANWPRSTLIATAPATAVAAKVYFRGVVNGAANPKIMATQLYFGKAGPNQTEFSDWSPAGVGTQIDGTGIKTGSITADRLAAGTITADLINSGTIGASTIILNGATSILKSSTYVAGTSGWQLKGDGSFEANTGTFKNVTITGTLTASTVFAGTWTAANIPSLDAGKITTGTLTANFISGGTLNCSLMTVTNLSASSITTGNLSATRITAGTITTTNMSSNAITYSGSGYQAPSSMLGPYTAAQTIWTHVVPAVASGNARGPIYIQGALAIRTTDAPTSYTDTVTITVSVYRNGTTLVGFTRDVRIKSTTLISVPCSCRDTGCPSTGATYTVEIDTGGAGFYWAGSVILMELKD